MFSTFFLAYLSFFHLKKIFIPILGHEHCGSEWKSKRSFLQLMMYICLFPLLAIMVYCCAVGCSNDSRFVSKGQGISFHRFPTKDSVLKVCLAKISRVVLEVTKDTRLCSDHFEPDCFQRDLRAELPGSKGKRNLKPGAVPTIFDHRTRKKPRLSTEKRLQEKAEKEVRITNYRYVQLETFAKEGKLSQLLNPR